MLSPIMDLYKLFSQTVSLTSRGTFDSTVMMSIFQTSASYFNSNILNKYFPKGYHTQAEKFRTD